jgi:hypothetical protein
MYIPALSVRRPRTRLSGHARHVTDLTPKSGLTFA